MAGLVAVVVTAALLGASDAFFDRTQVTENNMKPLSLPSSFPATTIIYFSAEDKANATLTVVFQNNERPIPVDTRNTEQNIIIVSKINSTRVLINLQKEEDETMTMTGLKVWSQARVTWRESHVLERSTALSYFLAFIQDPYAILLASLCILFAFSTCVTSVCMCRRRGKKRSSDEKASTKDEDNCLRNLRAFQHQNTESRNNDDNKDTVYMRENSLYGMNY